jgi:DMSO/TMAO reductase YedYZ molybdopterin-dependent catalytic subunit
MAESNALQHLITRRRLLGGAGVGALALANPGWAESMIDLPLPGGPGARPITTDFPQKGPMILQRTRPPLLETPFGVFDKSVFTPNDQFYVRWHWAVIPTDIDIGKFSLTVRGHVNQTLSLSLNDTSRIAECSIARSEPVLRQLARLLPASRTRRAMGEWRHG